jgi:hypothetical protein
LPVCAVSRLRAVRLLKRKIGESPRAPLVAPRTTFVSRFDGLEDEEK